MADRFTTQDLPRGGVLLTWGDWVAQIGIYPETIKDTMQAPEGVPQLFIIPHHMFDVERGVTAAELEFPVYYNFYLKKRKTRFLCRSHQLRPLWRVLREAVFGPSSLFLERDYAEGEEAFGFPDMAREMAWFKADAQRPGGRLRLRDLVEPVVFDDYRAEFQGKTITIIGQDRYRISEGSAAHQVRFVPHGYQKTHSEGGNRFQPPAFGVTVIGSGHGFDTGSSTSGFILWFNGRGVLVDPPVDTTGWLKEHGVDTRLVEDVVLTHCHADHDSGTLQKCMEEGRVRLFTTHTVHESFDRKYRALLGLTSPEFNSLFDFDPVVIGEPINIAGGEFYFHYTFHPIPTLGFECEFQGRRFAYSCDTLYAPKMIEEIRKEGVISRLRAEQLNRFPHHCDLIFHEAGVPPIHTPMSVLVDLPEKTRQKTYLTHTTQSAIPADSGLRLAPPGVEQTLSFENLLPSELGLAQRMLDVLNQVDLFSGLQLGRAAEFLRISRYRSFQAGAKVIETGDPGNEFFIILSGEAEIVRNAERINVIGRYDYFGEMAIVTNQTRTADVIAHTKLELIAIARRDFLRFIRGTRLLTTLRRVAKNRTHGSWPLFAANSFLGRLTTYQKTQLVAFMEHRTFDAEEEIHDPADPVIYLMDEGRVRLNDKGGVARRGALVGHLDENGEVTSYQAVTECQSCAYALAPKPLSEFFRSNPGTHVRYLAQVRSRNEAVLL